MSRCLRLRMSEPKGHEQISDFSVVLDLTFDLRTRGDTESNVKSTTLACVEQFVQPQSGDDVDILQIVGEFGLGFVLQPAVEFEQDSFLGVHSDRDDERQSELL